MRTGVHPSPRTDYAVPVNPPPHIKATMYLPERKPNQEWLGVLIAIPEPWVSELTELRKSLGDAQGRRVPAHITLLPPTPVDKEMREAIVLHLRSVAEKHHPFQITLSGAGSFLPTSPVAFLNVSEGADECQALAEDIRSGPLDIPLRFPYHPHATLAQNVDEATVRDAMERAEDYSATWLVPGFRLDRVETSGIYTSVALIDLERH